MTLLRWLTFLLASLTVTLTVLFFWIYLFLLKSVFVLQWLSLHWKILIILLFQFALTFSINSKWDAPFHGIACDYSPADWGGLCDHLRNVPWENIFKLGASAAASKFMSRFRLELMYISLIVSIRSSLIHLHCFQQLVLLP